MSDTDQHQAAARQHSGAVVEDVGVQLDQFILTQPSGLDQVSWLAISSHAERLRTALRSQDHSLALGCAKELVESVARVVLVARGHAAANKPDYLDVLKPAHAELEYQPGPGLAQDAPVRGIAANSMKIAVRLRDLRNDYGTGHGRAAKPVIEDEALVLAVEGALLWVRWALRRLEHLLAGQLTPLINDLSQAANSKKQWAERLLAADIPNLPEEDQRRLGVAVGQRAARGTFVVREAGIEDPLSDPNDAAWSPAYRAGTVEGAFINAAGQVQVDDNCAVIGPAARMADSVPDPAELVRGLRTTIAAATWAPSLTRAWRTLIAVMRMNASALSNPAAQQEWLAITADLESVGASISED